MGKSTQRHNCVEKGNIPNVGREKKREGHFIHREKESKKRCGLKSAFWDDFYASLSGVDGGAKSQCNGAKERCDQKAAIN